VRLSARNICRNWGSHSDIYREFYPFWISPRVSRCILSYVSEQNVASIFRVKEVTEQEFDRLCWLASSTLKIEVTCSSETSVQAVISPNSELFWALVTQCSIRFRALLKQSQIVWPAERLAASHEGMSCTLRITNYGSEHRSRGHPLSQHFMEPLRYITAFARALHLSLSWSRPIQSTPLILSLQDQS
jgi:hypothetical protein